MMFSATAKIGAAPPVGGALSSFVGPRMTAVLAGRTTAASSSTGGASQQQVRNGSFHAYAHRKRTTSKEVESVFEVKQLGCSKGGVASPRVVAQGAQTTTSSTQAGGASNSTGAAAPARTKTVLVDVSSTGVVTTAYQQAPPAGGKRLFSTTSSSVTNGGVEDFCAGGGATTSSINRSFSKRNLAGNAPQIGLHTVKDGKVVAIGRTNSWTGPERWAGTCSSGSPTSSRWSGLSSETNYKSSEPTGACVSTVLGAGSFFAAFFGGFTLIGMGGPEGRKF